MKISKIISTVLILTAVVAINCVIYADTADVVNVDFVQTEESCINIDNALYAIEFEDVEKISDSKGSYSIIFNTDYGDSILNCYYKNDARDKVTLTLYKKTSSSYRWIKVDAITVQSGDGRHFQVKPDSSVTYKIEVSNTSNEYLAGKLRVKSYD